MCTSWTHTDSIQSCMTIFVRKDPFFVTLFPFPAHHDSMIDGTLFFPWTSNYSWFGIKYQDILQTKIVNSPGDSRKWNWAHHDSRAHAAIVRSARQRYWTVPVWSWFLKQLMKDFSANTANFWKKNSYFISVYHQDPHKKISDRLLSLLHLGYVFPTVRIFVHALW